MTSPLILVTLLIISYVVSSAQGFSYEVSTVRPNHSASGNTSVDTNNNSYIASNLQLVSLIQDAFNLQIEDQVIGLPAWAHASRYDITAKLDAETAARLKALKLEARDNADQQLMQSLLTERFGLKFHHGNRELPEYALVLAKTGSKLKLAEAANPKAGNMSVHNGKMEAYSAEIKRLGYFLSYQVHRPIVDRTGLPGKYDMTLEWTRDDMANSSADGSTERGPSLFMAIQEQMGLKLESMKGPVDTIVIDHIEQPSEN